MRISFETMRQRQALPLEAKIAFTEIRIRQWYEHWQGDVYVSFSGGKDSTVLLDIVKRLYPDVPAVFCDTGLEYPEVRSFALDRADVVLRPSMSFKQVIEKYGYPIPSKEQALYIRQARHSTEHMRDLRLGDGRYSISQKWRNLVEAPFEVSKKCCDIMKKRPFHEYEKSTGRKRMTGMMAYESSNRERRYMLAGCNSFNDSNPSSMPLGVWLEQDILEYIDANGIEYAACYGDLVRTSAGTLVCTREDRTGCMFCMFGVALDGTPNRFQRMERDYPKQYAYCMEKLGLREVLQYCQIPYRYEMTLWDTCQNTDEETAANAAAPTLKEPDDMPQTATLALGA